MKEFILPDLPAAEKEKLAAQAVSALESFNEINSNGGVHAMLLKYNGHEWVDDSEPRFVADLHFPKGDRIDYETGSQYFYHCHREDYETEEHGHFHTFVRKSGWGDAVLKDVPEAEKFDCNPMTHLICVALNRVGMPIRLFTVNRWVARETMFEPQQMHKFVDNFDAKNAKGDENLSALDNFVTSLLTVFSPQIKYLQEQRDVVMAAEIEKYNGEDNPYLAKEIEELSSIDISLENQIGWIMSFEEDAA